MVLDFFQKQGGQVAIYDANNGTKKSRKAVGDRFEAQGIHVIFLGEFWFLCLLRETDVRVQSRCAIIRILCCRIFGV